MYADLLIILSLRFALLFASATDEDFSSVFTSIQYLAADWKKIGVNLEIPYSRIKAIESNRKRVDEKLMDLVEAWLRRESEKQPKPTWKKLCEAVSTVDRTRAEAIAEEHQCDCCYCLGNVILNYSLPFLKI